MIRSSMQGERLLIGHVYCETWKAAYRGLVPDGFLDSLTDECCAPRIVPEKGLLVCERNGCLIGAVGFGPDRQVPDGGTGEIYSLYVLPEYWRTGAGRELFCAARKSLQQDGFDSIRLWTLSQNRRARQFYEKMSMTECSCRIITIGGRDLPETGYIQTLN